jgi:hypothetical protein
MDAPDTLQPVSRPPVAVIAVSTLWCLGGCLEFFIWLIQRELFYLLVTLIAAVFTVLVLKGVRWVFWAGLGQFSLALGITILQLQIPGWAYGTPTKFLWIRAFISSGVILLHQLPSLRRWFGIRGSGKRWQVIFWLFVAGLTALGQYVLPTLKSL